MDKTNKKTAIVIGGSSGIGCETCLRLYNRGWHVVNISRTPCKNSNIVNIAADVAAGNSVADAIKSVGEKHRIHALIYSGAFLWRRP